MNTIRISTNNTIGGLVAAFFWVTGWVLAQGFWSTFFAFIFPPWGWYLIISTALTHWGII